MLIEFYLKYLNFLLVNIDQGEQQRKRPGQNNDNSNTKAPKRATDDYHFDKFRKQFRK